MGNIHGRFELTNSTKEALLIGSHMVRLFSFVLLFCYFSILMATQYSNKPLTDTFFSLCINRILSLMLGCMMDLWVLFVQSQH